MYTYSNYADPKLSFSEIIVPTNDSVRNTYLLDTLLSNDKHVLMVGATGTILLTPLCCPTVCIKMYVLNFVGTGKTINIQQYLMGAAKVHGKVSAHLYTHMIPTR